VNKDSEQLAVKFADGTWVESNLVVTCGCIRSRAAKVICSGENSARATGRSAFRFLIPDEQLRTVKMKIKDDDFVRDRFNLNEGVIWLARGQEQPLVW
jgi:hypothetical protein